MSKNTQSRKTEHLRIAVSKNVQFREKTTGLEKFAFKNAELNYRALPEINKKEIKLATEFLGKKFEAPLIVEAITGGIKKAKKINTDIAMACEQLGIGMCLGSQRAMIENPRLRETYFVRNIAPTMFLAGNIGVTELDKYPVGEIAKAVESVGGDALAIHLNAAQAAMQPEGETNFRNRLREIEKTAKQLHKPVYVKEVGHGIDFETAKKLAKTGIKAIDVGGAGGTSWTAIDSMRGNRDIGETFWDFGIPTAKSIIQCKKAFGGKIIASGGIRTGLDCAKAIALGADLCGMALPVLKAQQKGGSEGAKRLLEKTIEELRISMFLAGAKSLKQLKGKVALKKSE
jgi:isopentenyl-diphosphate delta-isomerase